MDRLPLYSCRVTGGQNDNKISNISEYIYIYVYIIVVTVSFLGYFNINYVMIPGRF